MTAEPEMTLSPLARELQKVSPGEYRSYDERLGLALLALARRAEETRRQSNEAWDAAKAAQDAAEEAARIRSQAYHDLDLALNEAGRR